LYKSLKDKRHIHTTG